MADVSQHTFNRNVDAILKECLAVSDQRGGEYEDTWDIKNIHTPFVDHVLRLHYKTFVLNSDPGKVNAWRRLLVLAALIDVKDSRMMGDYKEDTVVDGINYRAAFAGLMRDFNGTCAS